MVSAAVHVGVVGQYSPAAAVCGIPTVFDGWGVGLICGRTGLLGFFAFSIIAVVFGIDSLLLLTFCLFVILGASWVGCFIASGVCFSILVVVDFCPNLN